MRTPPQTQEFELAGLSWQVIPLDTDQQFEVEFIFLKMFSGATAAGLASLIQGMAPSVVELLRETALGGGMRLGEFDTEEEAEDAKLSVVADLGESEDERWGIVHPSSRVLARDDDRSRMDRLLAAYETAEVQRHGTRWALVSTASKERFDLANLLGLDTSDPRLLVAWERLLEALGETGGEVIREVAFTLSRFLDFQDVIRLCDLALFSSKTTVWDPSGERFDSTPKDLRDFKTLSLLLRRDPRAKYELLGKALLVTYGRPGEDDDEDA